MNEYFAIITVAIGIALLITLLIVLFLLPVHFARKRNHPSIDAIRVCTLLSLILWPLWCVAMIWAFNTPDKNRYQKIYTRRRYLTTSQFGGKERAKDYAADALKEME